MDSRILHAIILATILSPAAFGAEKDPRVECAVAAVTEYNTANLARWNSTVANPTEFMSVESQLAQRRLQENYCLKLAHCLTDGSSLALGAAFSGCLKDEEAEK
jgi:hypothetical protein